MCLFSLVWSFGGALFDESQQRFDAFLRRTISERPPLRSAVTARRGSALSAESGAAASLSACGSEAPTDANAEDVCPIIVISSDRPYAHASHPHAIATAVAVAAFPSRGSVFDYFFSPARGCWVPWQDNVNAVPHFSLSSAGSAAALGPHHKTAHTHVSAYANASANADANADDSAVAAFVRSSPFFSVSAAFGEPFASAVDKEVWEYVPTVSSVRMKYMKRALRLHRRPLVLVGSRGTLALGALVLLLFRLSLPMQRSARQCCCFPLSSFLFPLSSFLFPPFLLSSFLFPPFLLSSFLFPLSSFLFPLSSFLLPLSSFLFALSSFPAGCGKSHLLHHLLNSESEKDEFSVSRHSAGASAHLNLSLTASTDAEDVRERAYRVMERRSCTTWGGACGRGCTIVIDDLHVARRESAANGRACELLRQLLVRIAQIDPPLRFAR